MPAAYAELVQVRDLLERHYRDMQDIEFTVQQNKLYMLQTRNGKRTAAASLKIAVDMAGEGLIDTTEAVRRVAPASLDQLLHPTLDPTAPRKLLSKGLPASPGAACGVVVFSADEAEARANKGEAVILVRIETSPEDIHGMHAARGVLTTRGGMTSHAAVVARGMGRPCVAGAGGVTVDYNAQMLAAGGQTVRAGETITLDGASGEIFLGSVPMIEPKLSGDFATLMEWADKVRRLRVRANAETPLDAETARRFGAEGIGLCRTEHMFFDPDRIGAVRQMIMSETERGRREALARLLPFQRKDFLDLFRIMAGLPITIRLLDPPLHEFLPHKEEDIAEVARALGADAASMQRRAADLSEGQPDARPSRLPPGRHLSRDLRDAGPRHLRGGRGRGEGNRRRAGAGDHDPAGDGQARAGHHPRPGGRRGRPGLQRDGHDHRIPRRHHDRAAARLPDRRQDRRGGRLLLLRHQRPDADHLRPVARRCRQVPADLCREEHPAKGSLRLDRPEGVGAWWRSLGEGARREERLKLGICGEHGGDPASIQFCERSGSTTCPARPTGCRWRGWRRAGGAVLLDGRPQR
jgi:pyruvate,orthophosphate dikinase